VGGRISSVPSFGAAHSMHSIRTIPITLPAFRRF
jgi:hypothetical protein